MSRRARALAFVGAALVCAALAAALADGYRSRASSQFGSLRPVVVAAEALPAGRALAPKKIGQALRVRRVPARFVPPGALAVPEDALGRAPAAAIPAGSYLLAAQLVVPGSQRPRQPRLGRDRRPVQIAVTGAAALSIGGSSPEGARVDVVVTAEPRGAGSGRTYVAATGVRLLALEDQVAEGPGPGGGALATLALTREQALELIDAENFARQVRLLPHVAGG